MHTTLKALGEAARSVGQRPSKPSSFLFDHLTSLTPTTPERRRQTDGQATRRTKKQQSTTHQCQTHAGRQKNVIFARVDLCVTNESNTGRSGKERKDFKMQTSETVKRFGDSFCLPSTSIRILSSS
mmetsp:Transcript_8/g.27  ORF Transcript_8/g.27 Transcript_8/m.27 type:complete len:126 (+) Transcript_8:651-1028(+)